MLTNIFTDKENKKIKEDGMTTNMVVLSQL